MNISKNNIIKYFSFSKYAFIPNPNQNWVKLYFGVKVVDYLEEGRGPPQALCLFLAFSYPFSLAKLF